MTEPLVKPLLPLSVEHNRSILLKQLLESFSTPKHVFGLGSFGGNQSLIKYLAGSGHEVTVWEQKEESCLKQSWEALSDYHKNITIHWETDTPDVPTDDWIFPSPAFSPNHPWIKGHQTDRISSEIEISLHLLAERNSIIHVILGSVGKSTCASLLSEALQCPVYGNIGRSPLKHIFFMNNELILELSSFQLHYLRPLNFVPSSYFVTPIADNHSQWHGGLQAYQNAKLEWVHAWNEEIPGTDMNQESIDEKLDSQYLLGPHNRNNINAILKHIGKIRSVTPKIEENLKKFRGLHHRLEVVLNQNEARVINDSKATSPAATLNALKCIKPGSTLILQGVPVASDYSPIWRSAQALKLNIVLISAMEQHSDALKNMGEIPFFSYKTLEEAFESDKIKLEANKDILFSPGAPSYDQFLNFEVRGDTFKALAQKHLNND